MSEKVFFLAYQEVKSGRRGQISVFLLVAVIILLIVTVSLVNIGKVSTQKLNTANAADAAAIAGAASLASFENTVTDINDNFMKPLYYGYLLALGYKVLTGKIDIELYLKEPFDFAITLWMVGSLLVAYITLLVQGKQACRVARKQAHMSAFSNAGIQEAQRRIRGPSGEPTEHIVKSDLTTFLQGLHTSDSYTYKWYQYSLDPLTGKEVREASQPSVTSTVTGTEAFCIYPEGYRVFTKTYYVPVHNFIRKICAGKDSVPCGCPESWVLYEADLAKLWAFLTMTIVHNLYLLGWYVVAIAAANILAGTSQCIDDIISQALVDLVSQMFSYHVFPVLPPPIPICTKKCCPPPIPWLEPYTPCFVQVPYFIPVPYLKGITNNNADLTAEVRRSEPSKNLGFWTRKSSTVKSKARARTFGNFNTPGSYDCRIEYTE